MARGFGISTAQRRMTQVLGKIGVCGCASDLPAKTAGSMIMVLLCFFTKILDTPGVLCYGAQKLTMVNRGAGSLRISRADLRCVRSILAAHLIYHGSLAARVRITILHNFVTIHLRVIQCRDS